MLGLECLLRVLTTKLRFSIVFCLSHVLQKRICSYTERPHRRRCLIFKEPDPSDIGLGPAVALRISGGIHKSRPRQGLNKCREAEVGQGLRPMVAVEEKSLSATPRLPRGSIAKTSWRQPWLVTKKTIQTPSPSLFSC